MRDRPTRVVLMTQDATDDTRLILEGALTVRTIENVHTTLREAIEATPDMPANLSIDCSAATETDLAFVQLLIATRISMDLRGATVRLATAPDGVLLDTLTRGGFQVVSEDAAGFWFEGAAA
jgi:hypothetical protein